MNFYLLLYFFLTFLFAVNASYQRCEEISITSTNPTNQEDVQFAATLRVSSGDDGKNVLTLKEFTKGNVPYTSNSQNYSICVNFDKECFKNVNDSKNVENGFISIGAWPDLYPAAVREAETYILFYGPLNDGNFAFYDGRVFSETDKCFTYTAIDNSWLFEHTEQNIKTCCTSFQTVTPSPGNTKKCTNFNISSTLFNATGNTIITSSNADFMLSETDFIGNGQFGLTYSPFEIVMIHGINGMPCQWLTSTSSQYCHYPVDGEDRTLMLFASIPSHPITSAGTLIISDGQTLMAEGIPFSTTNNCQNFTQTLVIYDYGEEYTNYTVNFVSQFCCTSFDAILPPPAVPVQTNITEQKCNSIHTSATTTNFTISANLDVIYLNDTFNAVTINNLNISTALNVSNIFVCADEFLSGTGIDPISDQCLNFSTSVNFIVKKGPQQFYVFINDVGYRVMLTFFYGIIDSENFISYDGLLFDMSNQKCSIYKEYDLSVTSCCIAFNQTKSLQPITQPQCTDFDATSTLYNATDNSIYRTTSAKFKLDGTNLFAIGDFSENRALLYSINGFKFQRGVNGSQFGGFPVNSNSSEFLIHLSYDDYYYAVFVGRILLLDGQTFMNQDVLYTPTNKCYNFSAPYVDNTYHEGINAVSQFCCTNFADSGSGVSSTTSVNSTLSTPSSVKATTTTTSSSSIHSTSFLLFVLCFLKSFSDF